MIIKISKLKNFGVFRNFNWGLLDDFKQKNLIYGWNYSGKTTLSKLFQILEFKDKDKYFKDNETFEELLNPLHNFYKVDFLPENESAQYTIHATTSKELLKGLILLNH